MSAPARACESASRASSSSVASLSTSLPQHHAAMAVVGVLAHADVGDHGEAGHVLLDFANRALHLALVVPRLAAVGVLALRDAEQDGRRDAGRVRLARGAHHLVDRHLRHARHRTDRTFDVASGADEERLDKVVGRETRLSDHPAQRLGAPQPPWAIDWKRHRDAHPSRAELELYADYIDEARRNETAFARRKMSGGRPDNRNARRVCGRVCPAAPLGVPTPEARDPAEPGYAPVGPPSGCADRGPAPSGSSERPVWFAPGW